MKMNRSSVGTAASMKMNRAFVGTGASMYMQTSSWLDM